MAAGAEKLVGGAGRAAWGLLGGAVIARVPLGAGEGSVSDPVGTGRARVPLGAGEAMGVGIIC